MTTADDIAEDLDLIGGWTNGVFTDLAGFAAYIGASERTVRGWIADGKLPAIHAHKVLIRLADAAQWIESRKSVGRTLQIPADRGNS